MPSFAIQRCAAEFRNLQNHDDRVVACMYPKSASCIQSICNDFRMDSPSISSHQPIVLRAQHESSRCLLGGEKKCDIVLQHEKAPKLPRDEAPWISVRHAEIWTSTPGNHLCLVNTSSTVFRVRTFGGDAQVELRTKDCVLFPTGTFDVSLGSGLAFVLLCDTGDSDVSRAVPLSVHRATLEYNCKMGNKTPISKTSMETVSAPLGAPTKASRAITIMWPEAHEKIIAVTALSIVKKKRCAGMIVAQKIRIKGGNERMMEERAILARLDHPSVINIVDDFNEAYPPIGALNLEYLEMPSLDDLAKANQVFPPAILTNVVDKMLEYLQQEGVEHNDIKPGNIMATTSDFRLIDFGMSTLAKKERCVVAGTAHFVPAEVALESMIAGKRDIFAFGLTLLQLQGLVRRPKEWGIANILDSTTPDWKAMDDWLATLAAVGKKLSKQQKWLAAVIERSPMARPSASELR